MTVPHLLQVGEPYIAGRTSYPEAVQYNWRGGQHELLMWLRRPREAEVRAVSEGPVEFGLYVYGDVIILLYRFGVEIPWSDAPYTWHMVPEDERTLPPAPNQADLRQPDSGLRALLTVIFVDADTGLVRALRAVSLSPAFTAALHAAIEIQAAAPFDQASYGRALAAVYQRYPSSEALLAVAQIRTTGGR